MLKRPRDGPPKFPIYFFSHLKLYFLVFQESNAQSIQHTADFEGVLASILRRFLKASKEPKCGFRTIVVQFLKISGVAT